MTRAGLKAMRARRSFVFLAAWCCAPLIAEGGTANAGPADNDQVFSLRPSLNDDGGAGARYLQDEGGGDAFSDSQILWPGFLHGMSGFEKMPLPVSQPLYFEDPFIRTDFRFLYLYHNIPSGSTLRGGHLQTFALQIRLALTERLAFIATKDGYSMIRIKALPHADGWNDFSIGLKYALAYDRQPEEEWIFSGGLRWEWDNGDDNVLQGDSQELSPFLSYAHRWDKFNYMAGLSWRIPMDHHDAVHSLLWDMHFSYELWENFFPLVEFHGLHYLSNADRLPFDVEALDYGNVGSSHVAGNSVYWAGVGFRWHVVPHVSLGATYEFPLMNPDRDIFEERVTVNISFGI